jgi:hypothetical protein
MELINEFRPSTKIVMELLPGRLGPLRIEYIAALL